MALAGQSCLPRGVGDAWRGALCLAPSALALLCLLGVFPAFRSPPLTLIPCPLLSVPSGSGVRKLGTK